jgi:hypothetical protein
MMPRIDREIASKRKNIRTTWFRLQIMARERYFPRNFTPARSP